ncbi:MAG: TetR/AcrR family transcriptional regulator, regulator of autoinduction and epiphytic fitness [Actinomycetota bacterium]|nr:TetR/AcrR family transcriptional regulator, regulator of autoinduction and epiphytic fitness [Actinomycetota bacterium]
MDPLDVPEDAVADLDGRRQRSIKTRELVVDALLDLLRENGEQPSAQEVADRAGVSLRTVFRLFDDVESLLATAVAHQVARVGPLFAPIEVEGPLPVRVEALVRRREALFEEIAPVRRAALQRSGHLVIRQWLDESHGHLRQQITTLFVHELEALPERQRRTVLDALDVMSGWSAWDSLRTEQGLGADAARAVVTHTITQLLQA